VTDADLKGILSNTKKHKQVMLFSLLAATGLRIGEALALHSTDFGPDYCVLHVRRSIWRGTEQEPKTSNAVRVVNIPEVLAIKLREYLASTNGYLFATAEGQLLQQQYVLRILHRVKPVGFHAFRRFRLTWLRKNSVPKDLERLHAPEEVGDLYSKLKDDVSFRQEWAEPADLALSWYTLVHKTQAQEERCELPKPK
jgi:integrase